MKADRVTALYNAPVALPLKIYFRLFRAFYTFSLGMAIVAKKAGYELLTSRLFHALLA